VWVVVLLFFCVLICLVCPGVFGVWLVGVWFVFGRGLPLVPSEL